MKVQDFEKAIEALQVSGMEILEMVYGVGGGGQVTGVYARIGKDVYLFWDGNGRSFRYDMPHEMEGCTEVKHYEYLNYQRDACFDLKFE